MVLKLSMCSTFTDGGRGIFKMWLSPVRRAHRSKFYKFNGFTDGGRVVFNMRLSPKRRALSG
eukprot:7972045-Pyramimonas_sp.AAC.1